MKAHAAFPLLLVHSGDMTVEGGTSNRK